MSLQPIAEKIYLMNKKKGFWPPDAPFERDFGQVTSLIHSEIDEAWDAFQDSAMDDKLPHRYGLHVEIVDAMIRLLDACGAYKVGIDLLYPSAMRDISEDKKLKYGPAVPVSEMIANAHKLVSAALESHRGVLKEKRAEINQYKYDLVKAFVYLCLCCDSLMIDWPVIMDEKLAYNATRPVRHGKAY